LVARAKVVAAGVAFPTACEASVAAIAALVAATRCAATSVMASPAAFVLDPRAGFTADLLAGSVLDPAAPDSDAPSTRVPGTASLGRSGDRRRGVCPLAISPRL
jgi:hypothetical protein